MNVFPNVQDFQICGISVSRGETHVLNLAHPCPREHVLQRRIHSVFFPLIIDEVH